MDLLRDFEMRVRAVWARSRQAGEIMSGGWIKKLGLGLALVIMVNLGWAPGGLAQTGGQLRFFPETGHVVRGEFLEFFDTRGGLDIFGYPLTEPFIENGLVVQYFQNARFESHPHNPEPYRVQLGLLGVDLKFERPRVPPPAFNSRSRHYFPETGHIVSFAFLDFFRAQGGIDVFGYPITEMFFEDGRIVQYFQRLKMEWYPENRAAPVQIGNLGELYLNAYRERIPPEALRPVANPQAGGPTTPAAPSAPLPPPAVTVGGLQASMSLRFSVLGQQNNQVVSVLVNDTSGQPRPNAQVRVRLTNAAGTVLGESPVLLTDARGFVRVSVPISGGRNGEQVFARATVTFGTLQTVAEGVFLLWW